jgi:hypothetical protein
LWNFLIKIVTLIWLIHILYWQMTVEIAFQSPILEMTINFYYPTLELFCFSFTQPFTHSKFCLPNPKSCRKIMDAFGNDVRNFPNLEAFRTKLLV